ncbi:hypothetical protein [Paraliomyxa miuraensis]|uniref:hypothetical protein n=1 Tax=Paraliomyxa miuraensis TaxID=376150 RepID=UPI0022541609|nr:hypothetical protein [Paraliomyxa miuraensis]MCX4244991.1 hypothetical protein [Paraliomyxa miuraensis]
MTAFLHPLRMLASVSLVASACLLPGCGDDSGSVDGSTTMDPPTSSDGADSTGEPLPFDEAEVIELAGQYATALVQINDQPFTSQHALAAAVNVFVDPAAADLYRMLDPVAPVELAFPEGTLLVKEHLDGDGAFIGYNLMYRGPEGFAPDSSDWYWARVTAAGVAAESGAIDYCINCHAAAPGHAFGVAVDNRR